MARVLIQVASVGVAIEVAESLEAAGHEVESDSDAAIGPADPGARDAVFLSAERASGAIIEAWRDRRPPPALVVVGAAPEAIAALGVEVVEQLAGERTAVAALERALAGRFAARLSGEFARAALSLPESLSGIELAEAVVRAGRAAPAALVRRALAPHADRYVAITGGVAELRERRALEIPEVGALDRCDGTRTLQTVAAAGGLEPLAIGRLIWSLASVGGVTLTDEPPDRATPGRRRLAEVRDHLRRRAGRVQRASPYDVLEVHRDTYLDEIDAACKALGAVLAPETVADLDLATFGELPGRLWSQILEARQVLYYEHTHQQIDAIIDHRPGTYEPCVFGRADLDHREARRIFAEGQQALAGGEVFKAVATMARAARAHPDHPTYEAYLSWARYRAVVERGGDRAGAARRERVHAERFIYGRRPRAQALVALALLCVADGDADAARWHVGHASRLDPELPAVRRLMARLG